ncbi:MAG: DNA repair protein RecO [Burkholderiaceae bacterium]|jgi:DNA repair protein RecO (recombination protein O)
MDTTETVQTRAAKSARAARSESRIADEPAFVLHSYPYKETSLIVDAMTRNHGRVALIARGAKRPRSALRGMLLAFRPLALSWSGGRSRSSELANLSAAEWIGGVPPLQGEGLICGFYLNELLIKLLARDDPHESLFDAYLSALIALGSGHPAAPVLRAFEYTLLGQAGYALELTHCVESGRKVEADLWYRYLPERGPVAVNEPATQAKDIPVVRGRTLLDIARSDFTDPVTQAQSKLLARHLLNHHLAGQTLHTRQMLIDLHDL